MINISLNDLLNSPAAAPAVGNQSADAAAFSGLLDQIGRQQQAEPPAKPQRARNERAERASDDSKRDDEPAKAARRAAPAAAKTKAAEPAAPNAADESAAPQQSAQADNSQPGEDAAASSRQDETNTDALAAPTMAQAPAPTVIVAEQPTALSPIEQHIDGSDGVVAAPAAPAQAAQDADTDMAALRAAAPQEAGASKAKPLAAQTADANAAAAGEQIEPQTPAQHKAAAQAADLGKRLDNLPMQVAVQLQAQDAPKPLKGETISLANGMSHPAQTESATTTQTVAAAPQPDTAAAPGAKADGLAAPAAPTATPSASPAFAAMVDSANEQPAPAPIAGKSEASAVGGIAGPSATSATQPAQAAAPAAAKAAPLPQHPATEQVAVHIAKAAAEGVDKINVKLKPAALGNVEVQIDLAADGRVQVVVSADRADTLDLLQRDARGLEQALNSAGLQADQQSLSFNLRDQGMPNGNGGELAGRAGWQGGAETFDEPQAALGGYLNGRAAVGGVDIRV